MSGGSSPLARGKSDRLAASTALARFIPTRAGKMPRLLRCLAPMWVHPHSRGENSAEAGEEFGGVGSSPLARGKLRGGLRGDRDIGFIPTRAGKIGARCGAGRNVGVHPHSRGEN